MSVPDVANAKFCPVCENEGEIENAFTTVNDGEYTECGKCGHKGDPIEFYWLKAEDVLALLEDAESTFSGTACLTDVERTAEEYESKARAVSQLQKILLEQTVDKDSLTEGDSK